jgi:hypothetical protein
MASIQWKYSYHSGLPNAKTYYHGGSASGAMPQQLAYFATNHLNRSRGKIVTGLKKIEAKGKADVKSRARVQTGSMKRQVFSSGDYGTAILKVRFGWRELAPYYAPFQEFGTRHGIEPMMAVANAYEHAVSDLARLIR